MGIEGRTFKLAPPASRGTRASLYILQIDVMPPLLLRLHAHRGSASRTAKALRHLEALGLPAPRLVFCDRGSPVRLLAGSGGLATCFTLETWIDGTPHVRLNDPDLARFSALEVAALLARFHEVTRESWGPPSAGRLRSFAAHTLLGARLMIRSLQSSGWLQEDEAAALQSAFASWKEVIGRFKRFSLLHKDANRNNFIMGPSGQVTPVDLHRISYELFPEELVNALYHFCRKDPDLAARFEEAYFTRAGQAARDTYARTRGFFEPLNYLKKLSRRASQLPPRGRRTPDEKMERWRGKVLQVRPPGSPSAGSAS